MQYNIGSAVSHCIVVAAVQVEIINIIVVALLHATHTTHSVLNCGLGGSFVPLHCYLRNTFKTK